MEGLRFVVALGIFLFGAYFTGKLRGVPLREAFARGAAQAPGALSPAAALSSALCGTLGVGTVLAAISALAEGGPGVLLPLLVGTLTGCALKYAEILVTMRHRQSGLAGPLAALQERAPCLARAYALLLLPVALLGMGNLAQVQVLSEALARGAHLPRLAVAAGVLAVLLPLVRGGIGRIGRAASLCLPAAGALYVGACALALWRLRPALPGALLSIFQGALPFRPELFALGIARGLFLCEAGMGTSAFAHGQSRAEARVQGALGACEVLFSTFLCVLTALLVLATGVPLAGSAVEVALSAFRAAMGPAGGALLCGMLAFFALSTLPVWWFYGLQCARFLRSGRLAEALYTAAFLAVAFLGCLFPLTAVWRFADGFNLLLALPCLAMLFLYRREVVRGGPAKKRK